MFVAELSALNLGDYVQITGTPLGNKNAYTYQGFITEITHNKSDGYTMVRLWNARSGSSKEDIDKDIREHRGYSRQFLYSDTVEIISSYA